ncbi:MAG: integrase family protein [Labilithrix sp.]|nr:integrase family protein [Labilithrix sp.]
MSARLFKRGNVWFAWVPKLGGGTRKVSTQCTDRKAAEIRAAQLERAVLDPSSAAAATATLREALELLIRDRLSMAKAGKRSHATVAFYQAKAGVLVDGLAAVLRRPPTADVFLREVVASLVDDYVILRREDGVEESTISKELITWRSAMRLAKRRGLWLGDIEAVFPKGFSPEYQPGERWLAPIEVAALFRAMVRPVTYRKHGLTDAQVASARVRLDAGANRVALAKDLGISTATLWKINKYRDAVEEEVRGAELFAIVAFSIATGAEPSAIWRAERRDVAHDFSGCMVRGSKNKYRKLRPVPLPLLAFRMLLEYAVTHADGDRLLFPSRHQSSFRRTLAEACARAGIPNVTLTDLRRTHGKYLRLSGVDPSGIGASLGHADGRMAERIYGKASAAELAAVIEAQIAAGGGGLLMGGDVAESGRFGAIVEIASSTITAEFQCPLPESNQGHGDFQSPALPTELSGRPETARTI